MIILQHKKQKYYILKNKIQQYSLCLLDISICRSLRIIIQPKYIYFIYNLKLNRMQSFLLANQSTKLKISEQCEKLVKDKMKSIQQATFTFMQTFQHQDQVLKQIQQQQIPNSQIIQVVEQKPEQINNLQNRTNKSLKQDDQNYQQIIHAKLQKYIPQLTSEYFSSTSSKTKQVQQKLKSLHEQQKKFKENIDRIKMKQQQKRRQILQIEEKKRKQQEEFHKNKMRQQILDKIQNTKNQQHQRKIQHQKFKQFLKQFQNSKPLHIMMEQEYKAKQELIQNEKKSRVNSSMKKKKKPTLQQINQHQKQYTKIKEIKQKKHIMTHRSIDVGYKSKFYQQQKKRYQEKQEPTNEYIERIKKYSQIVKNVFKPKLRQSSQNEKQLNQSNIKSIDFTREKINDIGNSYLKYVRQLQKKSKKQEPTLENNSIKQSRYINYLQNLKSNHRHLHHGVGSNWLEDLKDKQTTLAEKRQRILTKSKQLEERAKRKQQYLKYSNQSNEQQTYQIDQTYIQAIKAKMAVLKSAIDPEMQ